MNDHTPDTPDTTATPLTAEAAQELTAQIRACVEQVWALIEQAFTARAWVALGYPSWDAYCASEFDRSRLRIPREERAEVVASMREIGMSTRAIAAATGVSKGTVQNDLAAGGQDCPPGPVTGLDDKQYPTKPAARQGDSPSHADDSAAGTRRRRPITEAFDTTRYELGRRAESLARLAADDRFDRHAAQLAHRYRGDLIRARDAIQTVLDRLPDPTTKE
ncbi:Uncharacterised protein [Nocardia otitidiscaviarum]|uniref:Uncharacterized protein n=1 Tax=Nocardia otitidiscaviarum TaxID=1823 RepID=A0A378YV41_9NOCA|nr:hypothetical protein [Nocardia otitidiscaviarum]SUA80407.1 Uncharacterised protein [Nocardia otitidiscaviarum]